jgi:hypothetical protein
MSIKVPLDSDALTVRGWRDLDESARRAVGSKPIDSSTRGTRPMAYTKVQLYSILDSMPDSTEIVVPSYRNPAASVTQISRHEIGKGPSGELMVILVPASVLPFRPNIPEEASNETSANTPDSAA